MATLYLVATPIGNREDITQRALRLLSEVAIVFAEDTRHSRQLLNAYGIKAELRSFHQHNENARINEVISLLDDGKNIALISDAGMPLVSDPGENIVAHIRQNTEHSVEPIPGASAVLSALVGSGLPSQPFSFLGFLPDKKGQRDKILRSASSFPHTLIFFVAIHDLKKYLCDIHEFFPEQRVVVARELTKMHESFYSGSASELSLMIDNGDLVLKGEVVLLVDNQSLELKSKRELNVDELIKAFGDELPASKLAKIIAKLTDVNRQDVYQKIEELKNK